MEEFQAAWTPHPDRALEARLARGDSATLRAVLADPALRNDPYARMRALDALRVHGPEDPRVLGAWLQAMLLGNRPSRAWQVTGRWPIDATTPADAQLLAAQVAQAVGRRDEARDRFLEVIARHPGWIDALQKYAEFERPAAVDPRIRATLERILVAGATAYDQEKAGFALSRTLVADDPRRAFALAAAAQHRKRRRLGAWREDALVARLARDAGRTPLPPRDTPAREVFVVGLPRSGTTLLASLLGAHSAIANAGEQWLLPALAVPDPSPVAADAVAAGASAWYRAAVGDLAADARVVVDKLPSNAEHAGAALERLPGALVVHIERDLADCATSIHMHDFEAGTAYATDGRDIGRYARLVQGHLHDLRERVPERVLKLRFETLVRSPEATLQPLLARLGLEWEPAMADFWRKDVQTATYSEGQVREPVHTRSIGSANRFLPASATFLEAVRSGADGWHDPGSVDTQPLPK